LPEHARYPGFNKPLVGVTEPVIHLPIQVVYLIPKLVQFMEQVGVPANEHEPRKQRVQQRRVHGVCRYRVFVVRGVEKLRD